MAADSRKITPLGETDAFVAAMEQARQADQGLHISFSVVELAGPPDLDQLRSGLRELLRRHPMLVAEARRGFPWTRAWFMTTPRQAAAITLETWEDRGPLEVAAEIATGRLPLCEEGVCNIRLDAGRNWALLSWRHLILDGVGAEWLLREFATLCADPAAPSVAESVAPPPDSPLPGRKARWDACQPMLEKFDEIMKLGVHSLAGPQRRQAAPCFDALTLDAAASQRVTAHASAVAGPLLRTWFFLACATRAHDAAWREFRGGPPPQHAVALPVQQRPRGAPGPIFRNNVGAMFFLASPELAQDTRGMIAEFFRQHQQSLRLRLAESFLELQRWMRILPARLYSRFLRFQLKGETTAFQHSFTGEFAAGMGSLAGAAVVNGYHIPLIFAPPGSGLFISEKQGRYTITTAWREGALTRPQALWLRDAFLEALLGENAP